MVSWSVLCCALLGALPGDVELLEFSASWCGPCRQIQPVVAALAAAGAPIRAIDIDQQPALARQYQVTSVPCFVMLVEGRETGRRVGPMSRADLERWLEEARQNRSAIPRLRNVPPAGEPRPTPATPPLGTQTPVAAATLPSSPPVAQSGGMPAAVLERIAQASVRLRVRESDGHSTGSGTIIDARQGEALVVTCGHLFRASRGAGTIEVDLFGPGAPTTVPGRLVSYDLQGDIGLVSFRTTGPVTVCPLAPSGYASRRGEPVATVGCSHGADPTTKLTQVTSVNKFLGPANLQVAGQPVQGRSGGGLFTIRGELLGVCNAADPQDNEGLFAALPSIDAELKRIGLDRVIDRGVVPATTGLAAAPPPAMPATMPRFDGPRVAAQSPDPPRDGPRLSLVSLPSTEAALVEQLRRQAGEAELVCILRSKDDPAAAPRVVIVDRASPELQRQLETHGRSPR